MKYLQYLLVLSVLVCLGAIAWAPVDWWRLLLTAAVLLLAAAITSNFRTDTNRAVKR